MSRPPADRNLLYGVLALVLGVVDRRALIEAMIAWVESRPGPLGQILLERLGSRERLVALPVGHQH